MLWGNLRGEVAKAVHACGPQPVIAHYKPLIFYIECHLLFQNLRNTYILKPVVCARNPTFSTMNGQGKSLTQIKAQTLRKRAMMTLFTARSKLLKKRKMKRLQKMIDHKERIVNDTNQYISTLENKVRVLQRRQSLLGCCNKGMGIRCTTTMSSALFVYNIEYQQTYTFTNLRSWHRHHDWGDLS